MNLALKMLLSNNMTIGLDAKFPTYNIIALYAYAHHPDHVVQYWKEKKYVITSHRRICTVVYLDLLLKTSKWVSDCCLTPNEQFFSYIMRWQWCSLCTKPTALLDVYSASSLKQFVGRFLSGTLSWFRSILSALFLNTACLTERQQIPIS